MVDSIYVNNKTQQNMLELETLSREIDALAISGDSDDSSWYAGITSRITAAKDLVNLENLKNKVELAVPAMLNLMALFVLKTLILPLLFLWLLLRSFRYIWGVDLRSFTKTPGPRFSAG